jgi:hypothetical protein
VFGDYRFDDARPEISYLVDLAKIDFAESSGERIEQFAQRCRLLVARSHRTNVVRSMTAAGLIPAGNGDAVVTSV